MNVGTDLLKNAQNALVTSYLDKSKSDSLLPILNAKTHWSFYPLVLATTTSVIVIIAGAILANIGLIMGGIFYAITTGIGAFYLHRFGAQIVFEKYVSILTTRVREITQDIQVFSKENGSLKSSLASLNEETKISQKILSEKELELRKISEELGVHSSNLQKEMPLIEKLSIIIDKYKNDNEILQQKLNTLDSDLKQFSESKSILENKCKDLAQQNQQMQEELREYAKQNTLYDSDNRQLKLMIQELTSDEKLIPLPKFSSIPVTVEDKSIDRNLKKLEEEENQINSELDQMNNNVVLLLKTHH